MSKNIESIKPLFLMPEETANIGNHIISFARDGYNKANGEALIDTKNNAEAISSFLSELKRKKITEKYQD